MTLLLTAPPEGFVGCEVVAQLRGYPYRIPRRIIEANLSSSARFDEFEYQPSPSPAPAEAAAKEESGFGTKFKTHRVEADTVDHYEALGLAHARWTATAQEVRQAFRKMSLTYHPDRTGGGDDAVFKRILRAYEVLSDPQRRREYDSQDETFDDRVPSESDADAAGAAGFYALFGPVFDRNARWAVAKSVPRLGDDATPYADVERFYAFWFAFKSWREFPLEEQYDVAEAESREERRWILRQNEKRRQKKKHEEHARVLRLAELAHRRDPRVQRVRELERAAKEQRKARKREDAERRAREEQEARARAERVAAEDAERERRRKEAEAAKHKHRRAALLRMVRRASVPGDAQTKAELLETRMPPQRFAELVDALEREQDPAKTRSLVLAELALIDEQDAERRAAEEKEAQHKREQEAAEAAAKKARAPWSEKELALLARAVRKYPPGVHDRWEKIAALIGTRSAEEVIEKTQEMKARDVRAVQKEDPYKLMKSTVTDRPINAPLDVAWDRVNPVAPAAPAAPSKKPAAKPAAAATTAAAAVVVVPTASAGVTDWTAEQQKALEQGLRTHKGKDKWEQIAQMVPGKSKDDCMKRFNFLKELLSQKKKAPAASKP